MRAWTWASLVLVLTGCAFQSAAPPPTRPAHGYSGGQMAQPGAYLHGEQETLQSERVTCYEESGGQQRFATTSDRYGLRAPRYSRSAYAMGQANQPGAWPMMAAAERAALDDVCVTRVVW